MKLSTLDLHRAQITRLEAQTSYTIFDSNPENEPYPYVVMGTQIARDWSDKSADGLEVHSTIHIWSQYQGRKEADEMSSAIVEALTASPLDLAPNFQASFDRLDSYNLIVDLDGITRHGILIMKYLIEEL